MLAPGWDALLDRFQSCPCSCLPRILCWPSLERQPVDESSFEVGSACKKGCDKPNISSRIRVALQHPCRPCFELLNAARFSASWLPKQAAACSP